MWFSWSSPMFWRKVMVSACSLLLQQLCLPPVSCWFTLWPWRWRQYGPSKHQWTSAESHSVTFQALYYPLGSFMGVLYIFSLDAIYDQPFTLWDCFKFSHNLIDMLYYDCKRKESFKSLYNQIGKYSALVLWYIAFNYTHPQTLV
jgi:hypothetical protein